jgi:hypothetical protein
MSDLVKSRKFCPSFLYGKYIIFYTFTQLKLIKQYLLLANINNTGSNMILPAIIFYLMTIHNITSLLLKLKV